MLFYLILRMGYNSVLVLFALLLIVILIGGWRVIAAEKRDTVSFDENYKVTWGSDHFMASEHGTQLQLSMDHSSGSGFASKHRYGSGLFQARIKLPDGDSSGVVTAFYLTSHGVEHDELDFEFLGNKKGKSYTLQTNVYANGRGDREQRNLLWFDPTKDFHTYRILRNNYQIVFFVDDIPIRVLKKNASINVDYFISKAVQIEASLWNGESWATDGGRSKINWSYSPFRAHFKGFSITGSCSTQSPNINLETSSSLCDSNEYFWNTMMYRSLNASQRSAYEKFRRKYMNYDYCSDKQRYHFPPPECFYQL